jgi:hypothetical protein
MFDTPTAAIVYGLRASQKLFHRYLDDLTPAEYLHQPCPGANCAAWLVGHLLLTDRKQLVGLGVTDLPDLPTGFEERFAITRQAAGTPGEYGAPSALVALFDDHRARLIAAVTTVSAEKLREAPPYGSPLFADRGEAAAFMALHTAMHLGQITIIRRSLGRPPVV